MTLCFALLLLLCCLCLVVVTSGLDPYATLGVSKNADASEIKKAYKKMVLRWHPDKNPDDPTAADKFMAVQEAHDILSDDTMRRNYDMFGDAHGPFGDPRQGRTRSSGAHDEFFRHFNFRGFQQQVCTVATYHCRSRQPTCGVPMLCGC